MAPQFALVTGIAGDTRRDLRPGDDFHALALAAWTSQDEWPMPVAISYFSELERLWPRPRNWSPLGEHRARVAAKLLVNASITRAEIAAEFGVKQDTLRRSGVWRRVDEIIANGLVLHPMHPTPDGRGITTVIGQVAGPGPHVVAFTMWDEDDSSEAMHRTLYYDRRTLLPRVWKPLFEDEPSIAGHRFLPPPRRSQRASRDVRDVYRAGDRLRLKLQRRSSDAVRQGS
jgi:hypothetical protein